jgi:hypothetical protein
MLTYVEEALENYAVKDKRNAAFERVMDGMPQRKEKSGWMIIEALPIQDPNLIAHTEFSWAYNAVSIEQTTDT